MNPQIGFIDDLFIYPSSLNVNVRDLVASRNYVQFCLVTGL